MGVAINFANEPGPPPPPKTAWTASSNSILDSNIVNFGPGNAIDQSAVSNGGIPTFHSLGINVDNEYFQVCILILYVCVQKLV